MLQCRSYGLHGASCFYLIWLRQVYQAHVQLPKPISKPRQPAPRAFVIFFIEFALLVMITGAQDEGIDSFLIK